MINTVRSLWFEKYDDIIEDTKVTKSKNKATLSKFIDGIFTNPGEAE